MSDDLPASAGNLQPSVTISANKEVVNAPEATPEVASPKEAGRESIDALPKEVASAGVTIHPTSIPIPPPVAKMGVRPAGANVPTPAVAITLPITDDQIAQGLEKSIRDSFRWLAEWCLRRLKQVHVGLKSVHGKLMRVNTR